MIATYLENLHLSGNWRIAAGKPARRIAAPSNPGRLLPEGIRNEKRVSERRSQNGHYGKSSVGNPFIWPKSGAGRCNPASPRTAAWKGGSGSIATPHRPFRRLRSEADGDAGHEGGAFFRPCSPEMSRSSMRRCRRHRRGHAEHGHGALGAVIGFTDHGVRLTASGPAWAISALIRSVLRGVSPRPSGRVESYRHAGAFPDAIGAGSTSTAPSAWW